MIEVFGDERPFEPPADDALVASVEAELGLRLPAAYVELARQHNGGHLARSAHPTESRTSWADDHVEVTSIAAIGRTADESLCGTFGSTFWVTEWGYPDIGVYFADCPSAGHDMIALDYRSPGEPSVVHVDQEFDYRITRLAPSFAAFITGLVHSSVYDDAY
ncbi:SMI1/KNR4 family protein [Kribbella sandramycini]|uniref:SMI1/KNR4 family protein n=1 Tax=Kribbella sandramycini TaxID=60450 RepID=A0A7Y4L2H7_9ACTN|nr:SMI1/KNR4 family protein [Kribbella sandramycini]MBB6571430.1 hypothetical protein [Kribbella sandramycini]NOL43170.1 SMI1/KNR4 family protein [Kribbella sandramycini]